ncbi:aminotransferase class IV [Candidatus Margulisiibacteriota bacterium]
MTIYINGKYVQKEKAKISVFDRGLLYGDGLFESIRTYGGKPLMLDEHLDRLYEAAKTIYLQIGISKKALAQAVLKTIKINRFKESYIKVMVTRGVSRTHGLDIKNVKGKPTIIIIVDELKECPPTVYSKGWKAIITSIKREDTLANIKSLNYINNIEAKIEANKRKANEAFMLTADGYLSEGTTSNLFFVKGKTLYTPSLRTGILEGLTRGVVIKSAKKLKIKVVEGFFKKEKLYKADECFVTSSGPGIIPIVKVDGRKIGRGKPGVMTIILMAAYKDEKTSL